MRIPASLVPLLLLATTGFARAQPARLVKDLDPRTGGTFDSSPRGFVRSGVHIFFTATTPATGRELFRLDDRAAGFLPVKDTEPGTVDGEKSARSAPRYGIPPIDLVDAAGTLAFSAADGRGGNALWRSDGSPEGTWRVVEPRPSGNARVRNLTALGTRVFFVAEGDTGATFLFVSDGTAAGTRAVAPAHESGCFGSAPCGLIETAALGDSLFFTSLDGDGTSLLRTRGEPGDAAVVAHASGSAPFFSIGRISVEIGRVFFTMAEEERNALFTTDGTLTQRIAPDAVAPVVEFGGAAFFRDSASSLWRTDGTPGGSRAIGPWASGLVGGIGASFLFTTRPVSAEELHATDGSVSSDRFLATLPGEVTASARLGTRLLFLTQDELWRTDGTQRGTVRVAAARRCFGVPPEMLADQARVLFAAADDEHGCEVWGSDGTAEGTRLLADVNRAPAHASGDPHGLIDVDGRIFFVAGRPPEPATLFLSDGSAPGTFRVAELPSTTVFHAAPLGGALLLDLEEGIWRSDGTPAGTSMLLGAADWVDVGSGSLWYVARGASELRRTDGVANRLVGALPPSEGRAAGTFEPSRGLLFFARGRAVYRSDGTSPGTYPVFQTAPQVQLTAPVAGFGAAYFATVPVSSTLVEVWRTDGTTAGTAKVAETLGYPRLVPTARGLFVVDGWGRLSFADAAGQRPLGTLDLSAGWATAGSLLIFDACSADAGCEPWRSDGTPQGTVAVANIYPGPISSGPRSFFALGGGRVLFAATTPETGTELWMTDGTRSGTRLLADVNAGPASGLAAGEFAVSGGNLFFTADDGTTGVELWALPLTAIPCAGEPCRQVAVSGGESPVR